MEGLIHSASAFFNSYLMESGNVERTSYNGENAFSVKLMECDLIVPLKRFSKLGRHEYTGSFYLKSGDAFTSIPFEKAAAIITGNTELYSRVIESTYNIVSTLKSKKAELQKEIYSSDFIKTEKSLFAGHTFHPAPKSRQGFTKIDSKLYSPEESTGFPLRWFFVDQKLIHSKASANFTDYNWLKEIFSREIPEVKIPVECVPFPMHPWQASRILKNEIICEYITTGRIREVEGPGPDWHPTSSLRTLYREDAPYMLKFSLNVKLTNSIRQMLSTELDRGLQVHDVLSTVKGKEFLEKFPDFKVLYEPVYLAIKDKNNKPLQETFVMGRENTVSSNDLLLAFMTQNHPAFEKNYIQHCIEKLEGTNNLDKSFLWLDHFMNKVMKPFISAESEYGILLGAHQQNLLVKIENNLPAGAIFRDCHGTGYLPKGKTYFGHLLDETNGNILDEKTGTYLFSYYLIINSLFNVVASIASGFFVSEEKLIQHVTDILNKWRNEFPESSCLNYVLSDEKLKHKGNFLCSFKTINENTSGDPLSIYVEISNPFLIKGQV